MGVLGAAWPHLGELVELTDVELLCLGVGWDLGEVRILHASTLSTHWHVGCGLPHLS